MTWTVFEHRTGSNETTEDAPGRGGYSKILVEADSETATEWWAQEYETDPHRYSSYPETAMEHAWDVEQYDDPEKARKQCGELTLDQGGIGSPMTRHYTWDELRGRLDVRVVNTDEVEDAL